MTNRTNPAASTLKMLDILATIRNDTVMSPADILLRAANMSLDLQGNISTEMAKGHILGGRGDLGQTWSDWHDCVQSLKQAMAKDIAEGMSPGEAAGRMIAKLKTMAARIDGYDERGAQRKV